MECLEIGIYCFMGLVILGCVRLAFVLPSLRHHQYKSTPLKSINEKNVMVLLGSGGHTGEMIRILSMAESIKRAKQIIWVISSGDSTSAIHLQKFEQEFNISNSQILELPRARRVGEGILSSIVSTLKTIISTFHQFTVLKAKPDVLLVNGPGTSVPICWFFFLVKLIGLAATKIVYIESLARVNDLSLSGKLCYLISERFIVQWKKLQARYPHSECYGILV